MKIEFRRDRRVWAIAIGVVLQETDPIVRSNIVRALPEAAIPVSGGFANDLAELEGTRVA